MKVPTKHGYYWLRFKCNPQTWTIGELGPYGWELLGVDADISRPEIEKDYDQAIEITPPKGIRSHLR